MAVPGLTVNTFLQVDKKFRGLAAGRTSARGGTPAGAARPAVAHTFLPPAPIYRCIFFTSFQHFLLIHTMKLAGFRAG